MEVERGNQSVYLFIFFKKIAVLLFDNYVVTLSGERFKVSIPKYFH